MSLNRALTEFFKAVRDEAANNPAFAAKLGDAMALHKPRRRKGPRPVAAEKPAAPPPAPAFDLAAEIGGKDDDAPPLAPALNPIAFLNKEGEAALREELAGDYSQEDLAALVAEHNLDPAGIAEKADKDGLIDQIVAQAKKRVARDKALFDY